MAYEQNGAFRFMSFNEWVPDKLRFWIYILFLSVFQFSNGMYFASVSQMSGDLSMTRNDVMMMGHAVLIGLTMFFPLAFRMKFRFTNRTCLLMAASGLVVCNILVPMIHSVPMLVVICFVAGFLRLFGTFECFSSILPKITPTNNYAIFLSFVFFVVIGVIQVFDVVCANIVYVYNWRYVHYLAVGLLLLIILGVYFLMRPFRVMPKLPLYGIDWLGMILWSIFVLMLIFVAQYGEQLDWLHSDYIRFAIGSAILALAGNVWRITHIRHPFIEAKAFTAKNLWNLLLVFLLMDILLSAQSVLQSTFVASVLRFDYVNEVHLKWFGFVGVVLGAAFSCFSLVKLKMSNKGLMFMGMALIVVYMLMMYFLVSRETNGEKLYIPLIICGFGHVAIFISLTVYAQATVPFKNYFQVLCVLGFIRTGLASPLGGAIYSRAMTAIMSKHLASFSLDANSLSGIHGNELSAIASSQAMLATIQELFGWSVIFGVIVLIVIATSRFKGSIRNTIPSVQKRYKAFAR